MSGSATFTIVMSSSSMKTPRQTAVSVHHFGSRPGASVVVAACAGVGWSAMAVLLTLDNHQQVNDYLLYDTRTGAIVKWLTIREGRTVGEASDSRELLPVLAALPGHLFWRAHASVAVALGEVLPAGVDIHAYAVLLALS